MKGRRDERHRAKVEYEARGDIAHRETKRARVKAREKNLTR